MREYVARNPEAQRQRLSQYYQSHKEEQRARSKRWAERNPENVRQRARAYQQRLRRAMPPWITDDERRAIREFYDRCPAGYHVDHIIPLKGKTVSGLHVLANLQYLPARENQRKSNIL